MNKEFITYEQALALKELGFDEPCFGFHSKIYGLILGQVTGTSPLFEQAGECSAPLYQQAFRWFREKHNLYHSIDTRVSKDIGYYIFLNDEEIYDDSCYWNYEEAEQACLDKLIEIVKNNSSL